MNNFKKVGLTALAGSLAMFSVAQADLVLSGSTEATYTSKGTERTAGNPFGLSNDFSLCQCSHCIQWRPPWHNASSTTLSLRTVEIGQCNVPASASYWWL